jgi:hypothetical protein
MAVFLDTLEHVRRDFFAVSLQKTTAMEPKKDRYGLGIGWQVEVK